MSTKDKSRERTIEMLKRRLLRRGTPRLLVSLILLLTGLGGFLTSFSLLHLGVSSMWLRYPIAILLAYCLFLLLLRLWLAFQRARDRSSLELDFDPFDVDLNLAASASHDEGFRFSGGGGDAGGGGAGGSWGDAVASSSSTASSSSASVSSGGSSSSGLSLDVDFEGCWFIVLAIVAIIAGMVAVFYVVYAAPALLAEILLDGVLLTGLYKRLKGIEQRHWLWSAVRRTLLPALLAAFFFSLAGYAMQKAAPEARSVGEVWRHFTKGER